MLFRNKLEVPFKFHYSNSMKIINNAPKVLTFVQFDTEDEANFITDSLGDIMSGDFILTSNGFFCKTEDVFFIKDQLEEMMELERS